jgi:hypothetical protein
MRRTGAYIPHQAVSKKEKTEPWESKLSDSKKSNVTRRTLLKAGAAIPLLGVAAPGVLAQAPRNHRPKILDFMTNADVAKAEQEGQLVFYCHENEAGTAGIMEGFRKDFPKINTSYVRAQTGALYNKILSERSAGRFDVDVIQLSDLAPAVDFQKKGGYEFYVSPETPAYKADHLSSPAGSFFLDRRRPRRDHLQLDQGRRRGRAEDVAGHSQSALEGLDQLQDFRLGLQFVQWYTLRKLYGAGFWKEFAKQNPHAFDSRVQLFDRLAKGDDVITAIGEYPAYILFKDKGAKLNSSRRPMGWWPRPWSSARSTRRRIRKRPSCSSTGRCRSGQAWYQSNPNLYYGSVRTDAPPMPTGVRLADLKLLYPADWDDYAANRDVFAKEWNGMLGL